MGSIGDDTKIAADYTVANWKSDRQHLINVGDAVHWKYAFNIFHTRIKTRFLSPIETILASDKEVGEGFTIVAIQCILVEFLAAFYFGKVYVSRQCDSAKALADHEYSSSTGLVVDFLTTCEPFKSSFTTRQIARDFFSDFRCGLLHEAATKKSAKIKVSDSDTDPAIKKETGEFILYRNIFQSAILEYLQKYREELLTSKKLQCSFLRKMDDICQIK